MFGMQLVTGALAPRLNMVPTPLRKCGASKMVHVEGGYLSPLEKEGQLS